MAASSRRHRRARAAAIRQALGWERASAMGGTGGGGVERTGVRARYARRPRAPERACRGGAPRAKPAPGSGLGCDGGWYTTEIGPIARRGARRGGRQWAAAGRRQCWRARACLASRLCGPVFVEGRVPGAVAFNPQQRSAAQGQARPAKPHIQHPLARKGLQQQHRWRGRCTPLPAPQRPLLYIQ